MDVEKFQDDVYSITELLSEHLSPELIPKLNFVRQNLIEYYKKNLVKINHSVLELICAAELISHGFSVDVEKSISDVLVCDLFGKKGDGTTIIEIETGFTPPEHALDTVDYYAARIVSKIARYSKHCGKFSLATPVVNILPISEIFLLPPNTRKPVDIEKLKKLCDRFYKNPQIKLDDIQNAHIHSVYLINTDKGFAKEMDPESYIQMTKQLIEQSEIDL
ncbi:MAG: hypothetical protein CL686_02405 [Candidatus Nitrosopelagicus sp.]|nr:hypothetical protein [Candidatus Nitrosopelagicus sp.]